MNQTYPILAPLGYKYPKLHQCAHETYKSVDISSRLHPTWLDFFAQSGMAVNEVLRWSYVTAFDKGYAVRPSAENVFNVFSMDPTAIRVVIVGQDPYPQEGIANGWAFATNQPTITSSLERLFASIPGIQNDATDYTLNGWIRQGVFLLNAVPVCWQRREEPDAGLVSLLTTKWTAIMRNVLAFIRSVNKLTPVIIMGERAKVLATDVKGAICMPHPSGRNIGKPFDGSCFEQVTTVDWRRA